MKPDSPEDALPEDVEQMLKNLPRPSVPAEVQQQMLEQLERSFFPAVDVVSASGAANEAVRAVSEAASLGSAGMVKGALLGAWGVPFSIATFVVGVAGGSAGTMLMQRKAVSNAHVVPAQQQVEPALLSPESKKHDEPSVVLEPPVPPVRQALPARRPHKKIQAHAERDVDLARERELIEPARSALIRTQAESALAAVGRHETEFPEGQLAEEREAIAVQALVLMGNFEDAKARATSFKQRFPSSLFVPLVESAVASIP
jgi:hypothetical protein